MIRTLSCNREKWLDRHSNICLLHRSSGFNSVSRFISHLPLRYPVTTSSTEIITTLNFPLVTCWLHISCGSILCYGSAAALFQVSFLFWNPSRRNKPYLGYAILERWTTEWFLKCLQGREYVPFIFHWLNDITRSSMMSWCLYCRELYPFCRESLQVHDRREIHRTFEVDRYNPLQRWEWITVYHKCLRSSSIKSSSCWCHSGLVHEMQSWPLKQATFLGLVPSSHFYCFYHCVWLHSKLLAG